MDNSEFGHELHQIVMRRGSAEHLVDTLAFVSEIADRLQEDPAFGEMILADDTRDVGRGREAKLHGFTSMDDADGSLSMVVGRWNDDSEPAPLYTADIDQMRTWLENFAKASFEGSLDDEITESSPAYELASTLRRNKDSISCIRLHIISNRIVTKAYKRESRSTVSGVVTELHLWDLDRIRAMYESGRERESIEIDLSEFGSYGIPCIKASQAQNLSSYLCVVDGDVLADLFERFGSRLLEGNVRSFLGMKGGVNKGIKATIQDKPGLFFAYNNGIAATAASAVIESGPTGTVITSLSDLQIVNGGQTTASILRARKQDKLSLQGVSVPMKLTIVNVTDASDLVPKIAEFANTQNKIAIADFFANHPFHRKMEGISRRLMVPARADERVQSKWFYERARGQYQNERMYLTKAGKAAFDLQFPSSQVINKTDLAKYDSVLDEKPFWVSLGAQKNFMKFAAKFSAKRDRTEGEHWEEISPRFADGYYQRISALALMWKAGESTVSSARGSWYEGDYRLQIVSYAWSLVLHAVRASGREINFSKLWERQQPDAKLMQVFTRAAVLAQSALKDLPMGSSNVGEWAKKEACWTRLSNSRFALGDGVAEWTVDRETDKQRRSSERSDGALDDGISLQQEVFQRAESGYWAALYQWEPIKHLVFGQDLTLLARAGSLKTVTSIGADRDWRRLRAIGSICEAEGFRHE
ncbi:AIPR family protein [Stenotrophomonas sp. TWI819]|uniref:AIPR family protein n=1 Tax=Stenotrophomonas sp. TWI819 TaxID=3136800 RepID=UPI00320978AC